MTKALPIVVLIGGNGSNLQALMDSVHHGISYTIAGVISHRPDAYGLQRAQKKAIATAVVDHRQFSERDVFDQALIEQMKVFAPKLIVMAGFMRILSPHFIRQFPGHIVNIHPSLLPNYKGLNTHQRVLAAKEPEHGVSIHFVTEELDGGPVIAQIKIPVLASDNVESLTQKVHQAEHWLYPQVINWFAENRLTCEQNRVTLDHAPLAPQGKQLFLPTLT